jgi:hypothetical protein
MILHLVNLPTLAPFFISRTITNQSLHPKNGSTFPNFSAKALVPSSTLIQSDWAMAEATLMFLCIAAECQT